LDTLVYALKRQLDEAFQRVHDYEQKLKEALDSVTLLSRDHTAKRLSKSKSALDQMVKKGEIAVTYIDRRPRFHLPEIARFIEAHTHKSRRDHP
jgi:hypothetical protein